MRKLVWFTIGFALASLAGSMIYGDWVLVGGALMFLIMGVLLIFRKRIKAFQTVLLVILGIAVGFTWFSFYDYFFVLVPRVADGQTLSVAVEATDYSYDTDYGCALEGKVRLNDKEYRVKAYLHTDEDIKPGDRIAGRFRFRLTTAGGMDDPTNHRSEGIFLLAYQVGTAKIEKAEKIPLRYYPALWRQELKNRIDIIFTGDVSAFASALLLGDRSKVTYEMNTSFKVSGISHIIAVSGLHVSILFGLIHILLAKKRALSFLIGVPILFLFAAVAGFSPSIIRACIMQSLMLLAMVLDREYDPPTSLAFAVFCMLIANPMTILSVSFQLSVGCMMGIFLFGEKIRLWMASPFEKKAKKSKFLGKIINGMTASASVSLSAMVITTPLVAYYFGCVSVVSIVTNMLVVWIISFVFYGISLCLIISLLSMGLAGLLVWVVSLPAYFVLYTAKFMASLPLAAVYTSSVYTVVWLVGAYILLILYFFQKKKQPLLLFACILFTLLLSQTLAWIEPMYDDFRVTMLDVGQGQSILLQSDGKTFLIDCGGDDDELSADITAEALLSQGISRLDGVIVTHPDRDHAGGVANLLTRIHTDRLILPSVEDEEGKLQVLASATKGAVEYVKEDILFTFGDTKMTIFAPISYYSGNESSICILFQREDCGILITGDRGQLGETVLLKEHSLPKVGILVAGHHGSAGSTTEELLKVTNPQIALISVGEDNRYGHPSNAVLDRLKAMGCKIYRTDIHGTIIFRR